MPESDARSVQLWQWLPDGDSCHKPVLGVCQPELKGLFQSLSARSAKSDSRHRQKSGSAAGHHWLRRGLQLHAPAAVPEQAWPCRQGVPSCKRPRGKCRVLIFEQWGGSCLHSDRPLRPTVWRQISATGGGGGGGVCVGCLFVCLLFSVSTAVPSVPSSN